MSPRAWIVWCVGAFGYALAVVCRTSLAAVGPDAAERFGVDAAVLSIFVAVQLAVYALTQVPAGLLLDRFGSRPILIAGLLLMTAGQLMMALSVDIVTLVVARVLLGLGDAAMFPGVLRLIATWFPAQRAPLMAQLTGIVGIVGQFAAIVPLAFVVHTTGWVSAFSGIAGLCLLTAVIVLLVVRNHAPQREREVSVDTKTGEIRVVSSALGDRGGIRAAWAHPGTRLAFWSHFTTAFGGFAFVSLWGYPFLTAGEGASPDLASSVFGAYTIACILFGPVWGYISGRAPHLRSRLLVLPTIGLQAVVWLAVTFWPGPAPVWLLFLLGIVLAAGVSGTVVAFDHARAHNPLHRVSTANGLTNLGGFSAGIVTILAIGWILDLQGAGSPANYTREAFRMAFLVQVPLWIVGTTFIVRELRALGRRERTTDDRGMP